MTEQHDTRVRLLNRRLELVTYLLGLNAEAQKRSQQLGGAEIDIQRLEQARPDTDPDLARNLREATANAETFRAAQADCDARIEVAEREMDEIDRQLASIDNRD